MEVTDIFVDLETTSVNPNMGAIIQIGAVKFNLFNGTVGDTFKVALAMPRNRFWDTDTRQFWVDRLSLFNEITKNAEQDIEKGFRSFINWVNAEQNENIRGWSKPLSFDFPFIQSYCDQYNLANPFKHWNQRDLRSFMMGVYGENMPKITMKKGLTEHDALADALNETLWAIDTWKKRND